MKPYYNHDGVTIYCGDCRELMPELEFDVIVADPPYGVGKDYGQCDDTLETFKDSVSLIASRGCPAAVFVPVCRVHDLPVRPQWMAIWAKRYGASALIAYPIYPHWEGIALYSLSGDYAGNKGHRSDVFTFAPARAAGSGHPTPKPLDLMKELCGWMPGGVILDPFMGSGTTVLAAKAIRRTAIGIEIEEKYCEIAAKRLSQEVLYFE
jgi:DNA modification methylase